jgi:xanthine dehydrogenase accessory factor
MSATLLQAKAWLAAGKPAIVVAIAQAKGSTPRAAGTRMLVSAHQVLGTIGGGHLEQEAIALAKAALAEVAHSNPSKPPASFSKQFLLGPSLGQCCGGAIELMFEPLNDAAVLHWPACTPRFEVQLYGAGHVGRALVNALLPLPGTVRWVESRSSELDLFLPTLSQHPNRKNIEVVLCDDPVAEVKATSDACVHLVMTHSHALDLDLVKAILLLPHQPVCGLIGSATKRAQFLRRLQQRGIPTGRLVCPIGLPGLQGKEPEVIATSVAAQILMGQWQHEHAISPVTELAI